MPESPMSSRPPRRVGVYERLERAGIFPATTVVIGVVSLAILIAIIVALVKYL